jgi:Ca2+-binding RTX toxin-like protein
MFAAKHGKEVPKMRSKWVLVAALSAMVGVLTALTGAALAQHVNGTNGDDTLTGTARHDWIAGRAGNDTINALGGFDIVLAGKGNDTVQGAEGRDYVRGGDGDDTLYGGPGNDIIFAERGVDVEYGGDGNDDLWAMAHGDVERRTGEPADTLNGENGNDRFHVRDGEADTVTCGAGFDTVTADYRDQVANDCERVLRHGAHWHRGHHRHKGHQNTED